VFVREAIGTNWFSLFLHLVTNNSEWVRSGCVVPYHSTTIAASEASNRGNSRLCNIDPSKLEHCLSAFEYTWLVVGLQRRESVLPTLSDTDEFWVRTRETDFAMIYPTLEASAACNSNATNTTIDPFSFRWFWNVEASQLENTKLMAVFFPVCQAWGQWRFIHEWANFESIS